MIFANKTVVEERKSCACSTAMKDNLKWTCDYKEYPVT